MNAFMDKFWITVGLLVLLFVVVLILPNFLGTIDLLGEITGNTTANITGNYTAHGTNMTAQTTESAFESNWGNIWFWGAVLFILAALFFTWRGGIGGSNE